MNNHTDAIRGTGCIVNENRMSVKYEWIRYACKRLGILCRASFRTKQTDADHAVHHFVPRLCERQPPPYLHTHTHTDIYIYIYIRGRKKVTKLWMENFHTKYLDQKCSSSCSSKETVKLFLSDDNSCRGKTKILFPIFHTGRSPISSIDINPVFEYKYDTDDLDIWSSAR